MEYTPNTNNFINEQENIKVYNNQEYYLLKENIIYKIK